MDNLLLGTPVVRLVMVLAIAISGDIIISIITALQSDYSFKKQCEKARSMIWDHAAQFDVRRLSRERVEDFVSRELERPPDSFLQSRQDWNAETLESMLINLLGLAQPSSAMVTGLAVNTYNQFTALIWLRFYWKGEWWVAWHDQDDYQFHIFPETELEDEINPNLGRIISMHTISYAIVAKYFPNLQ